MKILVFVTISKLLNLVVLHTEVHTGLLQVAGQLREAGPHHEVPHIAVVGGVVVVGGTLREDSQSGGHMVAALLTVEKECPFNLHEVCLSCNFSNMMSSTYLMTGVMWLPANTKL